MSNTDQDIINVLQRAPMSPSMIGREFAPAHIKDRAGWGRKWVASMRAAGRVIDTDKGVMIRKVGLKSMFKSMFQRTVLAPRPGLNLAQEYLQTLLEGHTLRSYKAPHANRPTPPRPHYSRYVRSPRYCNH